MLGPQKKGKKEDPYFAVWTKQTLKANKMFIIYGFVDCSGKGTKSFDILTVYQELDWSVQLL